MVPLLEQHRKELWELCRKYDVRRLDVFGSATDGRFDAASSDLDFVVQFNQYNHENAPDRFLGLMIDLEDLFGRPVDLVSDKAIQNPYFRQIVDNTRVPLYAA